MAIWTLDANVSIVEPFKHLKILKLLALVPEVLDAIVFFLFEIVGNLTVFAVDPCLRACLNMRPDFSVAYSLTALACYLS